MDAPVTQPANAVEVRALTKSYRLYTSPGDRLKEAFNPFGKTYHRPFNALDSLDITIAAGTTTGIIGRNGSGKSTLLQCICGIVTPTSGEVVVNGRIAALLELGAGFNPEFSGRDNLYINGSILGLEIDEIDRRLDQILAFADIGDYIDQPVRAYSSGMFVRLAFSIAIHVDPEILIVDEALAVGDIHFQAKCFDRFHQFREQGTTVIFVTHDLNMVTRYCDQAYLLDHGHIVSQGKPRSVVAEYRKREVSQEMEEAVQTARLDRDSEPGDDTDEASQAAGDDDHGNPDLFYENPYEVRYGNKRAKIISGGLYTSDGEPVQTLESGQDFRVCMTVRFLEAIEAPVFAFTIKDAKGTEIAGTNTRFAGVDAGSHEAGETVLVTFSQRLPLNAGNYLLSLGCVAVGGDELVVYDRRHDFLSFQVITERAVVGIVDLDSVIEITTAGRS